MATIKEEEYLWSVNNSEKLQFWSKGSTQRYISAPTRAMPKELVHYGDGDEVIVAPQPIETDILALRGISAAGTAINRKGYYHFRRNYPYHVALFCLSGSLHLDVDGEKHNLEKGEILIIPSGCVCDERVTAKEAKILWFDFLPDKLWKILDAGKVLIRPAKNIEHIKNVAAIYESEIYSKTRSFTTLEKSADLLAELLRNEFTHNLESEEEETFSAIFLEVSKNPALDWSIDSVAKRFSITRAKLEKICLQTKGKTFTKLVLETRLRRGLQELSKINSSLADAAKITGYSTPFAFSKAFKKHFGKSPRRFVENK